MQQQRILITGATGQVAFPLAISLAEQNTVWAAARFSDPSARDRLEAGGVQCVTADLADTSLDALPEQVDYVLNFAVLKTGDWDADLAASAESVALLMARYRDAKAFLQCSSTAVYQHVGSRPLKETDALGDNHRAFLPTYSICKIASEAAARAAARQWNLPTTIARLNVPYGDLGGWPMMHLDWMRAGSPIPIHPERPNLFNPIHDDDIARQVPKLLEVASVPATVVNWGGPETVALEDWCEYLGKLVGIEPQFVEIDMTPASVVPDLTRMHDLIGPATVDWRDGFRRMVEARGSL